MIGRSLSLAEDESAGQKSFDDFELRLGDVMRGERATMGKSLLDVQRELKIKATYIAAIENCDPAAFETPGFIAGYVRSYARYLVLDPEWAFSTFCVESNFETAHGMADAASPAKIARAEAVESGRGKRDIFADSSTQFLPGKSPLFSTVEPGALGSVAVLIALIGLIGFGGWTVLQEVQRVQFAPVNSSVGVATGL
ncbi:MAG: helix-turn-helix domain-containing protein, partial [Halocynthiibacter sp.]